MSQRHSTMRPASRRISGFQPSTPSDSSHTIPMMLVPRAEACRQVSDARGRFLLGFIDDATSVFDLVQSTGLPLDEAAEALADLYQRGLVGFASPA